MATPSRVWTRRSASPWKDDPVSTDTDEQAWRQGLEAGLMGLAADANPYASVGPLALDWRDGWREGTHPRNLPIDPDAWALWASH